MNGGKVADIYALRAQDNITFIPGDVQNGYAKVPRVRGLRFVPVIPHLP